VKYPSISERMKNVISFIPDLKLLSLIKLQYEESKENEP